MLRRLVLGACAVLALVAMPAFAGQMPATATDPDSKAWFYNRPGTTPQDLSNDFRSCKMLGERMIPANARAEIAGGVVGGLIGALAVAVAEGARAAGAVRAYADDCMIARGYRRFETIDANMAAFESRYAAMDDAAKLALSGSETPPEGALTRQWVNSFWVRGAGEAVLSRPYPIDARMSQSRDGSRAQALDLWDSSAPITLGPNDAVVVMSVRLMTTDDSRGMVLFSRDDPQTGEPATAPIGRRGERRWPMFSTLITPGQDRELHPTVPVIFVVPAGVYGLAAASVRDAVAQFCLGTIQVALEPGAVVDLGSIEFHPGSAEPLTPAPGFRLRIITSDLESRRAVLAHSPELAARLTPASYRNGHNRACQSNGVPIDSFSMPGVPWVAQTPAR